MKIRTDGRGAVTRSVHEDLSIVKFGDNAASSLAAGSKKELSEFGLDDPNEMSCVYSQAAFNEDHGMGDENSGFRFD